MMEERLSDRIIECMKNNKENTICTPSTRYDYIMNVSALITRLGLDEDPLFGDYKRVRAAMVRLEKRGLVKRITWPYNPRGAYWELVE